MKNFIALAGILAYAGMATAQVVDIPSASGDAGTTITITATYTEGTDVASFNNDVQYDLAALGPVSLTCPPPAPIGPGGASVGCNDSLTADSFRIGAFTIPSLNITSGNVAVISWNVPASTAPGNYPLVLVNDVFTRTDGSPAAGTTNVGVITVNAPAGAGFYASAPAPGENLALGTAIVGDTTAPAVDLNVQNLSPDTDFEVTGINSMDAQLNTPAAATVPFGDNVDFPFDCTPAARGNQDGSFEVVHDAANGAASPVSYNFTCTGLAPNVQVPAGPIMLNGITVDPADPSAPVTILNDNTDGFSSIANNLTATAGAGDTEITVSGGPTNLAAGDDFDFTVTCDRTTAGTFTRTIDFAWDNPDPAGDDTGSIEVDCVIINEIAEYESAPAIGSTLDFGDVLNGQTSAPLGVDIGNSDTDAVPNAELEITAASIAGPDAAVFTLVTDPTGDTFAADTAPDGTPDAEVTCSPTDGFSTFTATLSIESNDPDDSPAEYPLTCDGDNDVGLDSTPPPGDVDLGIIPPGGDATSNITIENTGTTDPTDLTCTGPTGDPEITVVSPTFPVTLGPGESADIVLNCAPSAPGSFEATLSCEATVPGADPITLDYSLSCIGQAIEVPTLSRIGMLSMILALMAVGFIGFRLRQN